MSIVLNLISCTVHGFENAWYNVTEREEGEQAVGKDRLDTTFKLNVKGTTIFGAALTLIGHITSEAGPDTGQALVYVQISQTKIPYREYLIILLILGIND